MVSPPEKGHGVAYVADVQTKGRGSKGRVWQAKHSSNIYVSFIIHRPALEVVNLLMSYNRYIEQYCYLTFYKTITKHLSILANTVCEMVYRSNTVGR